MDPAIILGCLVVLWLTSRKMVDALSSLARDFQIPSSVAGATLAALGASAPALGTCTFAVVLSRTTDAAAADLGYAIVIGAAIFNLCLLVGIPAMLRPLKLDRRVIIRDGAFFFLACGLTVLSLSDGTDEVRVAVSMGEAACLVALYLVYLGVLIRDVWTHPEAAKEPGTYTPGQAAMTLLGCSVVTAVASYFLVLHALALASPDATGKPAAVLGMSALAIGLALPGLLAAVQAARAGETALAISTALGSSVFNLCIALGLPALIHTVAFGPLALGTGSIAAHVPPQFPGDLLLIGAAYLLLVLVITLLLLVGRTSLERTHGAGLIALYPLFAALVVGLWQARDDLGPRVPLWNGPLPIAVVGGVGCVALLLAMFGITRAILSRGGASFAVARHVVEEALRAKAALVPIALLILLLPIAPLVLDAGEVLRYRIQTCLSYTLTLAGVLLSLMTVLLATSTLSGEIFGRQIYTVIVKPVRRGQYLFGRWLGLMWLNGVLLALVGVVVYTLVHTLAALPDVDRSDRLAVADQVLVARAVRGPSPNPELIREVERRMQVIISGTEYVANPAAVRRQVERDVARQWYAIGWRQRRTYVFKELGAARSEKVVTDQGRGGMTKSTEPRAFIRSRGTWPLNARGQLLHIESGPGAGEYRVVDRVNATTLRVLRLVGKTKLTAASGLKWRLERTSTIQLRLRVHASKQPASGEVKVLMFLGRRGVRLPIAIDQVQTFPINASLIEPDGTLRVTFYNYDQRDPDGDERTTLSFGAVDGLVVLYRVDSFGPNLVRTLLILWIKLGFLAALGLATASYMTFPVACLVCMVCLFVVNASGYLLEATDLYAKFSRGAVVAQGVGGVVGFIASAANKYASFAPTDRLVDGRLVSWRSVGSCFVWIGLFWTGGAMLIGYLVFRLRELARVLV